jgi:hypothetical protein
VVLVGVGVGFAPRQSIQVSYTSIVLTPSTGLVVVEPTV